MGNVENNLEVIFFGAIFVAIGVLMRQVVSATFSSMPFHFAVTGMGIVIGSFANHVESLKDPLHLQEVGALFRSFYITLLMFDGGFNTDVHYFTVMVYHLVVFVLPMFVLQYITMIFLGIYMFPYDFTSEEYIMMMSIAMTPGPQITKSFLNMRSCPSGLKIMLLAETLLGNCIVWSVFKMAVLKQARDTSKVVAQVIVDTVGGVVIGYVVGRLIIFWISRIFKDVVNQITIVMAFVFAANASCRILGISGFQCLVTIGLVMADQKASMTAKSTNTLTQILGVMTFVMTSIVCITGGIYVSTLIVPMVTVTDIFLSVVIFIVIGLVRALALIVTYPMTRSYLTDKRHALILWACNLRGSYSLTLVFTLLDKTLYRKNDDILLMVTMLQILIGFVVNPSLSSILLDRLNRSKLVCEKAVMVERAARILIELKQSVLHTLQNSVFTADADWDVVHNQTKLRPDFMKSYHGSRYLKHGRKPSVTVQSRAVDRDRMRENAIRQMVVADKKCYSHQFEQGILSRQSVLHLNYFINECLRQKKLMDPAYLSRRMKNLEFLQKLEKDATDMVVKGLPPLHARVFITAVFSIDILLNTWAVFCAIFVLPTRRMLTSSLIYNGVFLLGYLCVVLLQIIQSRQWRPMNMWHYIHRLIVLITCLDVLHSTFTLSYFQNIDLADIEELQDTAQYDIYYFLVFMGIAVGFTRFFRAIQLVEVIPLLQKHLLTYVCTQQQMKTFIEFDMAVGFKKGVGDTMRKVNHITEDRQLASDLNFVRHKCKLMLSQYIGLSHLRYASVMLALKTKLAVRLTLNAQEQALLEMKETGLLGTTDEQLLRREIETAMISTRGFPYSIPLNSSHSILRHIPWAEDESLVVSHIHDNSHFVRFLPGDVIVTQGHMPGGIFIILNGLVRGECVLDRKQVLAPTKNREPYITHNTFASADSGPTELVDFHARGNIIGELAFLTGKPGHKTMRCATVVETLFVSKHTLVSLTGGEPGPDRPMHPFERRMWRTVAIRHAMRFIMSDPSCQSISRTAIHNRMADAYIVDGNMTRSVDIPTTDVSIVILVQGHAKHLATDLRFCGPCIIPYDTQKLQCLPEKGPRVVFLFMKSTVLEEEEVLENNPSAEELLRGAAEDDDALTIYSGSSDGQPCRRIQTSFQQCDNHSVFIKRLLQTAMLQDQRVSTAL